ncbi:MAG TPA: hypothetical protein VFY83_09310 [Anaerolineales bacterium]|nr:hypothetical protein [Anaerolineales bacterium]
MPQHGPERGSHARRFDPLFFLQLVDQRLVQGVRVEVGLMGLGLVHRFTFL